MLASHSAGPALASFAKVMTVALKDLIDKGGTAKYRAARQVTDPTPEPCGEADPSAPSRFFFHFFTMEAFATGFSHFRVGGNFFAFLV